MNVGKPAGHLEAVIIRHLIPGDIELFRSVRLAALEDSPDAFGETLAAARQSDWPARTASVFAATPPNRATYLAVTDAHAVGMVFVSCRASHEPAFLGGMWVHPTFRRRGIGRSLVSSAFDFLRAAGQTHVSLWVTDTHADVRQFYESLGFERTGATATLRPGSDIAISELTRGLT